MVHLTGRMRARVGWFRVILQVEVSTPVCSKFLPPPRIGDVDRRSRRTYWRDAHQSDLSSLEIPATVGGRDVDR